MLGGDGTEVVLGEEREREKKRQTEWRGDIRKMEARWARGLIIYGLTIS